MFKILIDFPFWRDDFENRFWFFRDYSRTTSTTKNVTKVLQ